MQARANRRVCLDYRDLESTNANQHHQLYRAKHYAAHVKRSIVLHIRPLTLHPKNNKKPGPRRIVWMILATRTGRQGFAVHNAVALANMLPKMNAE